MLIVKSKCVSESVGALIAVLVLVSMSLNCNVLLKRPPFTTVPPNKADLVGTWVPDASTLKEMSSKGGYDSSVKTALVLRNDGTFELSNMPDWWNTAFSESNSKFNQYSGRWSISQHDSQFWHLTLEWTVAARVVDLFGQHPPHQIAFRIGDPDNDRWMVFQKQ